MEGVRNGTWGLRYGPFKGGPWAMVPGGVESSTKQKMPQIHLWRCQDKTRSRPWGIQHSGSTKFMVAGKGKQELLALNPSIIGEKIMLYRILFIFPLFHTPNILSFFLLFNITGSPICGVKKKGKKNKNKGKVHCHLSI